jgi:type II secretion system protein N
VKRFLIAGLAAALFVIGLWIVAVPETLLTSLIEGAMHDSDMSIETAGVKKGPFFDFTCDGIHLKKNDKTLIELENIAGKINPLSLLMLRLNVHFHGETGGGRVKGTLDLLGGKSHVEIALTDADVAGMPFLGFLGIEGKGVLKGVLKIENARGDVKFSVNDARFGSGSFGGAAVPLDVFTDARGAMSIAGDSVRITSFALEGNGIYARVSGDITAGKMNLIVELMPEKSFKDSNFIFLVLEKYKTSPGHYSIPITGSLPL